ncbi:MAG: radical SAM protein, partial [Bacteroidaceae bacterium]|nr:radical SAM protein [Bacteroidaceae bacterium]
LTFAGNGEPTIHPQFAAIIDDTLALRDKYFPNAKVSVLSNATMITRPAVFDALKKVDNNILKLDTVDTAFISSIDRPNAAYKLSDIIERMKAFDGHVVIQTMFLKGIVDGKEIDNTGDGYVLPWIDTVRRIAPREVMIYTIDRETPCKGLQKATPQELDRIVALLHDAGIKASASY